MAARCFVVRAIGDDPRAGSLLRSAAALGVPVATMEVADLWFVDVVDGAFDPASVIDAAIQHGAFDDAIERGPVGEGSWVVEKALLAGVNEESVNLGECVVRVVALVDCERLIQRPVSAARSWRALGVEFLCLPSIHRA